MTCCQDIVLILVPLPPIPHQPQNWNPIVNFVLGPSLLYFISSKFTHAQETWCFNLKMNAVLSDSWMWPILGFRPSMEASAGATTPKQWMAPFWPESGSGEHLVNTSHESHYCDTEHLQPESGVNVGGHGEVKEVICMNELGLCILQYKSNQRGPSKLILVHLVLPRSLDPIYFWMLIYTILYNAQHICLCFFYHSILV